MFQKQSKQSRPLTFRFENSQTNLKVDGGARPPWLQSPYFVGMIETREKMFIFFREVAVEAEYEQEMVNLSLKN